MTEFRVPAVELRKKRISFFVFPTEPSRSLVPIRVRGLHAAGQTQRV